MSTEQSGAAPSRFVELIGELMGANMVQQTIRDVLANASPEMRQQLSNAVAARLIREVGGEVRPDPFKPGVQEIVYNRSDALDQTLREHITPIVVKAIQDLKIDELIKKLVAEHWKEMAEARLADFVKRGKFEVHIEEPRSGW